MNARAKQLHDEALSLKPEGATHDSTLCPFCNDQASTSQGTPSGSQNRPSEVETQDNHAASEGGTRNTMDTITLETHELKVAEAVRQALAPKDAEIATLNKALETVSGEKTELAQQVETLTTENTRLNGELDTAQVQLRAKTDEVAALQKEKADAEEKARLTEIASARAAQVKNLGLFSDEYVENKKGDWAAVDEAAWSERVDEWTKVKGAAPATTDTASATSTQQDTASAMTGSAEDTTSKPKARRAVLGLN